MGGALRRTTTLVVDASAFVEYVLGTDVGAAVGTVIEAPDSDLNAPALCDVELCAGIRRLVRVGSITIERAVDAMTDYLALPLVKHGHSQLIQRSFELRDNFTASDATYVALCESLGATLVTCDGRLTRAVQGLLPMNVVGVT